MDPPHTAAVEPAKDAWQTARRRALIALVPCGMGIFVAVQYFLFMTSPVSSAPPFADALTYQAAGERLNAGHLLYALGPGDRPVLTLPGISSSPLLSPPPIAVLWRLIVAVPFGFQLWVVACWVAVLTATFYLVFKTGLRGAVIATVLSPAIGEQLAACNVAAFFPGLLVLAWRWRDRPGAGAIIGLMASIKLTPGTLGGWLVATRRWRGVATAAGTVAVIGVFSVLGSSVGAFADYVEVARTAGPSTSSLSGLTGVGWVSPAVLVVGTVAIMGLGRWPRIAFIVGVVLSVVGTPALYLSSWVPLIATLAPFADKATQRERR